MKMLLPLTCHFFFTELRPLFVFYMSLRSYLQTMAYWTVVNTEILPKDELALRTKLGTDGEMEPLGIFLACVQADTARMTHSFSSHFEGACIGNLGNKMMSLPVHSNQILAALNYAGLALVFVFMAVLLTTLARYRPGHFGQGRYLAFTFEVSHSRPFKICAKALLAFTFLLFVYVIGFLVMGVRGHGFSFFTSFLAQFAPTLLGLLYGIVYFTEGPKQPQFDYTSAQFCDLRFTRPWMSIFANNFQYLDGIMHSIAEAKVGAPDALDKITGEHPYSSETQVLNTITTLVEDYTRKHRSGASGNSKVASAREPLLAN